MKRRSKLWQATLPNPNTNSSNSNPLFSLKNFFIRFLLSLNAISMPITSSIRNSSDGLFWQASEFFLFHNAQKRLLTLSWSVLSVEPSKMNMLIILFSSILREEKSLKSLWVWVRIWTITKLLIIHFKFWDNWLLLIISKRYS